MATPKPWRVREPYCIHSRSTQPASACDVCSDGPELREWREAWSAWLAENPESAEAQWVAQVDALAEAKAGEPLVIVFE